MKKTTTASAVKCKNERTEPWNGEENKANNEDDARVVYQTQTSLFSFFVILNWNREEKNIAIIIIMI